MKRLSRYVATLAVTGGAALVLWSCERYFCDGRLGVSCYSCPEGVHSFMEVPRPQDAGALELGDGGFDCRTFCAAEGRPTTQNGIDGGCSLSESDAGPVVLCPNFWACL